jgi:cysteine synthase A
MLRVLEDHRLSYDILKTVGNTPMLGLSRLDTGTLYAKAEFLNPGGSIKDRVAVHIVEEGEKSGALAPDSLIVEATSGNTGIGFAFVGACKGYRVRIVMPENMSEERKKIIEALGAELELTPADKNIQGAVNRVKEIAASDPKVFVPSQFENPLNPEAHYLTTGPEIWSQMNGRVDVFVAGVGSGGTLGGVGRFLKEQRKEIQLIAVEPKNSAALLGHEPGLHSIQGIGDGFIPPVLDTALIDRVLTVSDEEAIDMTRRLARMEGLLVGTSAGANIWAAMQIARELGPEKNVVTVLPDRAERYFSTALL